jgi:hypothetical protein
LKAQYEPIKDEIMQAWSEVLGSMRLFLGPNVQAFEREFAAYLGCEHAIGVADGTSAIHLALRACEIGPGDEVITVAHTFMATIEAILLASFGGAIGVALGYCASWVGQFLKFPAEVPLWAVVLGIGVSCGVGLIAGIYPAWRASRLDPAVALRDE